jgi:hypothetical protein
MNQEALRSRLQLELDLVTADAMAVARGLNTAQLSWTPPAGGWSIGQVLEHIVVSADSYLERLRGLVYFHHAAHAELGTTQWEPSVGGWVLVASMRKPWKLPSPRSWQVGEARPDVTGAFLDRQDAITRLLRASAALEWNRVRLASPVSALIRLNLGDCFTILIVHAQRHVNQMQRIRDSAGFPA